MFLLQAARSKGAQSFLYEFIPDPKDQGIQSWLASIEAVSPSTQKLSANC